MVLGTGQRKRYAVVWCAPAGAPAECACVASDLAQIGLNLCATLAFRLLHQVDQLQMAAAFLLNLFLKLVAGTNQCVD